MVSMRDELLDTLRTPEIIRGSRSEPDKGRLYYKWFDKTVMGSKWVCAVVQFLDDGDHSCGLPYVTGRMMWGEEIWRTENQ